MQVVCAEPYRLPAVPTDGCSEHLLMHIMWMKLHAKAQQMPREWGLGFDRNNAGMPIQSYSIICNMSSILKETFDQLLDCGHRPYTWINSFWQEWCSLISSMLTWVNWTVKAMFSPLRWRSMGANAEGSDKRKMQGCAAKKLNLP